MLSFAGSGQCVVKHELVKLTWFSHITTMSHTLVCEYILREVGLSIPPFVGAAEAARIKSE